MSIAGLHAALSMPRPDLHLYCDRCDFAQLFRDPKIKIGYRIPRSDDVVQSHSQLTWCSACQAIVLAEHPEALLSKDVWTLARRATRRRWLLSLIGVDRNSRSEFVHNLKKYESWIRIRSASPRHSKPRCINCGAETEGSSSLERKVIEHGDCRNGGKISSLNVSAIGPNVRLLEFQEKAAYDRFTDDLRKHHNYYGDVGLVLDGEGHVIGCKDPMASSSSLVQESILPLSHIDKHFVQTTRHPA